jgi:hypothetical protein
MQYGSAPFGTTPYGDISPQIPNPNATISLNGFGNGGRLNLVFSLIFPTVGGAYIDLNTLGNGGRLELLLNRNPDGSIYNPIADAGELWRRVPMHSGINFRP